jgi:hypothetical protein
MSRLIFTLWAVAAIGFLIVNLIGMDEVFLKYYSLVLQTLSAMAGAVYSFRASASFPLGSPLRISWRFVSFGVLAWGLGQVLYTLYPIMHNAEETPYPWFSDIGFLSFQPLLIVGLFVLKVAAELKTPWWGWLLAVIVTIPVAYLTYGANSSGFSDPSMAMFSASVGYTVMDPLLVFVTILTASCFRGGAIGDSWWYVVAGTLLCVIANQFYNYQLAAEAYQSGSVIDIGWILSWLLIAWGGEKTYRLMN